MLGTLSTDNFYGGRKMKRIISIVLLLAMSLSLFSCGLESADAVSAPASEISDIVEAEVIEDEAEGSDEIVSTTVSAHRYSAPESVTEATVAEETVEESETARADAALNGFVYGGGVWRYYVNGVMKRGWVKYGGEWFYMNSSGVMQTGWTVIAGKWYYFNSDGIMQTGWIEIRGEWYYFNSNGEMQTGWVKDAGAWFYLNSDGEMQTGWTEVGGKWYFMNANGVMQTGWMTRNGKWYYLNADGEMQTGWVKDAGAWFYMNSNGEMQTGWTEIRGTWYYMNANGVMQTGWIVRNGKYFYLNSLGEMQTGWTEVAGRWYFMNTAGEMQTGWLQDGGKWYYLNSSGTMRTGWWTENGKWYYFNASGEMQTGWTEIGAHWYYMNAYGVMQTGWLERAGAWYYLSATGEMQTGWIKAGGLWYYLNESGVLESDGSISRPGNSSYGYYELGELYNGKNMQSFYLALRDVCEAFLEKKDDFIPVDKYYSMDILDFADYGITQSQGIAVWKVFYNENPRYYWMSYTVWTNSNSMWFCMDDDYVSAAYRAQCDAAIENMALTLENYISSDMSELGIALTIHNFIINRMDYSYEADGVTPEDDIWAHNIVGCSLYNYGVCESYAKTYLYLCLLNGLDCVISVGDAGGRHAWNIVEIDGEWYFVDCTWDDTATSYISFYYFGSSEEKMLQTHTPDSAYAQGLDYFYDLPEMSDVSMELVCLFKNGIYYGTYISIDDAYLDMTDPYADYELYYYEAVINGQVSVG